MPRTVITGGAGFLGSHLCDRFVEEGHEVICIDNLITGHADNVAHLTSTDRFLFIKHDVTNYVHVPGQVDYVLHFASPASPIDYIQMPIQTLKVGSLGTHKALGLAKEKGARVLLASTSEIYGDPLEHPQREQYWGNVNPIGERGVYDEAKRFAEAMTMAYHTAHGLDTRIVRIFNTYGPRMRPDDGRAVSNFITQALRGDPITVYGTGEQTRSFCYVSDTVEGIYRVLMSEEVSPVNIGNPNEMTVNGAAQLINEMCGGTSELVYEEFPTGDDPKVRQPSIDKARSVLGWEPKVSFEEGLRYTISYFRDFAEFGGHRTQFAGTATKSNEQAQEVRNQV